jgi:hypothetical protein
MATDDEIVRDALEGVHAAIRRRRRHVDQEQQAKEAELLAMVQDTGLTAVDLGLVPVKGGSRKTPLPPHSSAAPESRQGAVHPS